MKKIFAIAWLSVRSAISSKLVISLVALLLFAIIVIPAAIKGDGTVAGEVEIILRYSLRAAMIILGTATLWASCAAISLEIEDKQIQLMVSKPVRKAQIWMGKWLGIIALNALLLCLSGLTVYGQLLRRTKPFSSDEQAWNTVRKEILVCRRRIPPRPELVDAEVHEQLRGIRSAGNTPPDASYHEMFSSLKKQLLARKAVVAPGNSKQWLMDVPGRLPQTSNPKETDSDIRMRFRLTSSFRDERPVKGVWSVGTEETPAAFIAAIESYPDGVSEIFVPPSALAPGGTAIVAFSNAEKDVSRAAVFHAERGLELLIPESAFEWNLGRTLIVMLCHLSLIAALGLTAGALFSFPVAGFAAVSVIVISTLGHCLTLMSSSSDGHEHHHHGAKSESSVIEIIGDSLGRCAATLTGPVIRLDSLALFSEGTLVSWKFTAEAFLMLAAAYSGILGLLGAYALSRREPALPP